MPPSPLTSATESRAEAAPPPARRRALPMLALAGYTPGTTDPQALTALVLAYCALPCALKLLAGARRVRIPGTGAVESLNIATAVGVVAAEFWRQHRRG